MIPNDSNRRKLEIYDVWKEKHDSEKRSSVRDVEEDIFLKQRQTVSEGEGIWKGSIYYHRNEKIDIDLISTQIVEKDLLKEVREQQSK